MLLLYEDFIYLLRERFSSWAWSINTDGEIRTERADGEELDPITAMHALLHHRFLDLSSYRIAARYLGLDSETADAIAQASDLCQDYNAHVRADLIDALGLEEPWGRQGRWGDRAFIDGPYPHQYDQPFHRGCGSGGFASAATWRAPSKFTPAARSGAWRWKLTVSTRTPADAVSISYASGGPPRASSSSFSVGTCRPGFDLYYARCAAD